MYLRLNIIQVRKYKNGICDWKHMVDYLESHESNRQHKGYMLKWINLEKRRKTCSTINSLAQSQIK